MGQYWIRSRGRVQGPFTQDRIQGLLRRGRFSRHFHVSENKKSWFPAGDFPELFAGVGRQEADDDETPFNGGASPFDDDDMPPVRVGKGSKKASRARADDDEDVEEEDDDEEEWEDDEEWDDEDSGVLGGLLDWVEAKAKVLAVLLVVVLGGLGWFVFGRESFTQDKADLEVLMEVKSRVTTAHELGVNPNEWVSMGDATTAELSSMVERLNDQASSMDHVKQELLWAARDDIPKIFKELPRGEKDAEQRIMGRFSRIEEMINAQVRQHAGSVITLQTPPPPKRPDAQIPGDTTPVGDPPPDVNAPPGPGPANANPGQGQANPGQANPGNNPAGSSAPSANKAPPGGNGNSPKPAPGMTPPPGTTPPPNANNEPGNIPGRPKAAKF